MANDTTAPAQNTLRIQTTSVFPQFFSSISLGETIRMNVRQNPGNGEPGLLYFRGQLVKAVLPSDVNVGDKLLAEVARKGDSVVFKILDIFKGTLSEAGSVTSGPLVLAENLQKAIFETPTNLRPPQPLMVKEDGESLEQIKNIAKEMLAMFGNVEQLSDPKEALQKLQNTVKGDIPEILRGLAAKISAAVEQLPQTPAERFILALRNRLATLLQDASGSNPGLAKMLNHLVETLTDELKRTPSDNSKERALLRETLKDLKQLKASPENPENKLQQTLSRFDDVSYSKQTAPGTPTPKNIVELQQLAARLEQLAHTQEILAQLNPVMQALGEPALILFPFLFRGLLAHSEVTVRNNGGGSKKHGKKEKADEDSNSEDDGGSLGHYHRVQVSVPLPSLGKINVDIAHKEQDILVRFTSADSEAAEFIIMKIEGLRATLNEKGFSPSDLSVVSEAKDDQAPSWALSLPEKGGIVV